MPFEHRRLGGVSSPLGRPPRNREIVSCRACVRAEPMLGGNASQISSGRTFPFSFLHGGPSLFPQWVLVNSSESLWILVNPSKIKWGQVSPSESKWVQVSPSESKWIQVSPSESKWVQVNPSESKWVQVNPSESKWDQVSPSETKWNQVSPLPLPPISYPTLVGFIGI